MKATPTPRSVAIPKRIGNLDWASVFAAIIYPALGVLGLVIAFTLCLLLNGLTLHWWYPVLALFVGAVTLVLIPLIWPF